MPSDLSQQAILRQLTTRVIGRNLLYYPVTTSTMDIARKAAQEGAIEGTTIVAEQQTAGRGRLGRTWLNPPGVMAISVILRPELNQLPGLTMIASLATSRSIEQVTGLKTAIKWPNDILISHKKVSGILIENALSGESVSWAVVGIGINVNFNPEAFPEIADTATSIFNELGKEFSLLELLLSLLGEMEQYYFLLQRGDPIYREWQQRLETLGKIVRVRSGDLVEEGRAESVDENGSLLLRRSDGSVVTIVAGDVTLRR